MTRSAARRAPAVLGLVTSVALCAAALPLPLQALQWGVSGRYHLNWGGPDSRAGDVPGYGVALRRALGGSPRGPWEVALALDRFEYDLETPVHATGVQPRVGDLAVDAFTTVTRVQLDLVRRLRGGADARWAPHAAVGAGLYVIDVPDVSGNVEGGGTFELATESPTTAGVTLGVGSDWRVVGGLSAGLAAAYSQTFSRYRVTERRSGARGTISPFAPLGLSAHLLFRW